MNVQMNSISQSLAFPEMNPEEYMIYCARVSSEERINSGTAPRLLKYLIKHGHWSPFEMISIGIEVTTSRAIAAQILRHRSFSFQEFSQRYAEVSEIEPVQLREQAATNRQSSTDHVTDIVLNSRVSQLMDECQEVYGDLINNGVAKECARMVLPLATQTTIVMHGTLRSWIHFFEQRCSVHAQLEVQELAFAARNEIAKVCPWTADALNWS